MPNVPTNIQAPANDFTNRLIAAVEASAAQRIHATIAASLRVATRRGPGRPRKTLLGAVSLVAPSAGPRRKRPKQLCPVPRCKGVAAPVFGMVCSEHKDVPKAKIEVPRREACPDGALNLARC